MACYKLFNGDLPELTYYIVQHLRDEPKSIYSCALINRHLCRLAIPMIWEDPFSVRLKTFGEPCDFIDIFSYLLCDDDIANFKVFGITIKSNEPKPLFRYPTFIKTLVLSHLELHLNNWICHRRQPCDSDNEYSNKIKGFVCLTYIKLFVESDATLSRLSMKSSESYDIFLPELFEIIFHSSKFISNIKRLNIDLSEADRLNIQEFVLTLSTLAPCIEQVEFSEYNGNLPVIIASQKQLSTLTLKKIQMNDQILDGIKQCFRTLNSIKFMNCEFKQVTSFETLNSFTSLHYLLFQHSDGLKNQMFQPLIDNPTSLKVRSLRLIGELTEYSSLLQKIGPHVENLVIKLFTHDESNALESVIKYCTKVKFLQISSIDTYDIPQVCELITSIGAHLEYLSLKILFALNLPCIFISSKLLDELGPVLSNHSSSLKYLNLFLSIDPIFMRNFLDEVQDINLKKLLIRNCHYEDVDVAFDVLKEFAEEQMIDDFVYEIVDFFCIHTKVRDYIDEVQKNKYPDLVFRIPDFE
ncbi:4523_t:CDS:1 [Funneliformis mosseae]|uniref:4523_t:CDS:1 n=1 Tax=Funneliformis mosseae TaxID=27381 RepID=A0A9N9GQ88_FUNMO|nr:4523_t:CDS:1 [Funneliformis mosseae]